MAKVNHSFKTKLSVDDVASSLSAAGWEVEHIGNGLAATQGSQVQMRVLGGWFVNPKKLPKRVTAEPENTGSAVTGEDTMGVGIMDAKLEAKYQKAFAELERSLK